MNEKALAQWGLSLPQKNPNTNLTFCGTGIAIYLRNKGLNDGIYSKAKLHVSAYSGHLQVSTTSLLKGLI